MDRFWLYVRLLASAAFLGFAVVGLGFALLPGEFTGAPVGRSAAFWHGLALAFMATVSVLALMVAVDPRRYWPMLLPLAVGKAVSSLSSMAWLTVYPDVSMLAANSIVDGAIALASLALYVLASRRV